METEQRHIITKFGANICRFLLGAVFVFSGFVKAVDPSGSFYKLQDYLTAFGMNTWFPNIIVLLSGIGLAAIEFCVGVFLILGVRRKSATLLSLVLMGFMTPLTLYLAIANPVSDCGCFGDAWGLTNWQTFGKNLVLLAAAIIAFKKRSLLVRFITPKVEWMVSMYSFLFIFFLAFYCLSNLPILDFRPYKIGTNIPESMKIPEGKQPDRFETTFILEKDGKRQKFSMENYPDSTWTFVENRTVLAEKGYTPPIHDFFMLDAETGEDITEQVLSDAGYHFLLIAHHLEEADDSHIDLINEIYDYSIENGYGFYCLTASQTEEIELWSDRTGAEYPFYQADDITLKTIIRSNPGLVLIKEGVILNKWSDGNLPDEYVLTDRLENIELGEMQQGSAWQTIGYTVLWFIVPLLLIIILDVAFIKRRERKAEAALHAAAAAENHSKDEITN